MSNQLNGTAIPADFQPPDPFNSPYHYLLTRYVTIIYVTLYGLSSALHLGQAIRSRLWWLLPTIVIAGLGETAGWSGRLWSSINVPNHNAFMLQLVVTILAPTPMLAANFIMLGRLVLLLGPSYSRLPPRLYALVFCIGDVVTLVVQGVGGGLAASGNTTAQTKLGSNIMLGGIVLQLVILVIYVLVGFEFFVLRYMRDRPFPSSQISSDHLEKPMRKNLTPRLKIMIGALIFSTLCFVIRGIYRVVELAGGFHGRVISTQVYFNVLDGMMITLAIWTMNFVHPGQFLYHPKAEPALVDD